MKKYISLLLVAVMLMGMLPTITFAADAPSAFDLGEYGQIEVTIPEKQTMPTVDGTINPGEYALVLSADLPAGSEENGIFVKNPTLTANTAKATKITFYMSSNSKYVYFAAAIEDTHDCGTEEYLYLQLDATSDLSKQIRYYLPIGGVGAKLLYPSGKNFADYCVKTTMLNKNNESGSRIGRHTEIQIERAQLEAHFGVSVDKLLVSMAQRYDYLSGTGSAIATFGFDNGGANIAGLPIPQSVPGANYSYPHVVNLADTYVETETETATEPPVTEPPVTEPPVTEPPVTEPPVTEPPVTEPPETEAPETEPLDPFDLSKYGQIEVTIPEKATMPNVNDGSITENEYAWKQEVNLATATSGNGLYFLKPSLSNSDKATKVTYYMSSDSDYFYFACELDDTNNCGTDKELLYLQLSMGGFSKRLWYYLPNGADVELLDPLTAEGKSATGFYTEKSSKVKTDDNGDYAGKVTEIKISRAKLKEYFEVDSLDKILVAMSQRYNVVSDGATAADNGSSVATWGFYNYSVVTAGLNIPLIILGSSAYSCYSYPNVV